MPDARSAVVGRLPVTRGVEHALRTDVLYIRRTVEPRVPAAST